MIQRTKSEMKAYVDGYNACFNQFIENLKGINENPLYKIISNMHVMRAAVNAVVESEEDMPNSLKCKIKHLCHNRTITESECDRILKALEQEPKFVIKSDGTIEQIKNCNDCLLRKEWERIGKMLSATLEKQTEQEHILDKIDEIITDALDKSTDQKESQTLRWVLDKISEVM